MTSCSRQTRPIASASASMVLARPMVASGRAPPIPEFGDGEPDPPRAEVDSQDAAHPADGTGSLAGAPSEALAVVPAGTASELDAGASDGAGEARRGRRVDRLGRSVSDHALLERRDATSPSSGQGSMTTSPYGCEDLLRLRRSGAPGRTARARRHRAGAPASPSRVTGNSITPSTTVPSPDLDARRVRHELAALADRRLEALLADRLAPARRPPRGPSRPRSAPSVNESTSWPTRVCGSTVGVGSPSTAVSGNGVVPSGTPLGCWTVGRELVLEVRRPAGPARRRRPSARSG